MKAINLKTEYLYNPIGIDITRPRLFWNCEGGITQTAYEITATDSNGNVLWNSGKVMSEKMAGITMDTVISSRTRVFWNVRLWDENDRVGKKSETAFFETGLLKASDWKAKWISGNYKVDNKKRYPVDCFKKHFFIGNEIKQARLYATACGLYEIKINGKKAGDFVLAPGITDYRKRIQYQTYDVSDMLVCGQNSITAELADGWYRGSTGAWGLTNQYGTQTKLLIQLEIVSADGKLERIISDSDWSWSNDSAIRFADNKDGETVDSRLEPSYNGKALETTHSVTPTASNNVAIKEKENFRAVMTQTPGGKKILDFGRNFAGYISFSVAAIQGQKIILRFGEMLDDEGELTQKNIQCSSRKKTTPLQKVEYICRDGVNTYKTKFAIFGFQYVEVDTEIEITADSFTAYAVYSDMKKTGYFSSSNELLNRFVEATEWSVKSNSADLPTDCPTRERHGWTGDAQVFFESAAYLFDYASFAKKYLADIYDWQRKSGRLPQIAPYGGVDFYMWTLNGSVGWADAGVLIPYRFAEMFGGSNILSEYYDRMKKYAEFMISRIGKIGGVMAIFTKPSRLHGQDRRHLVNCGQSYGEWAEPEEVHKMSWKDMVSPHPEVSTAYTVYVMKCMSEIAKKLGYMNDAKRYSNIADNCRSSYQALMKTKEYTLDTDRQAQLVRPLYFKLLDKEQTEYAKKRLIEALDNYGWRLGTGFLSTPIILDVLSDINIEYAYKLLENKEMPGWLFMTKNGATTIWESWEGKYGQGGIASLNHYSKGAVCRWLFNTMCGVKVNGENSFIIEPHPGGNFSYAGFRFMSIYGEVSSKWERIGEKTVYSIVIPPNCKAEVILPDNTRQNVTAGEYTYVKHNGKRGCTL